MTQKYLRHLDSQAQITKQEEEDMTRYMPGECISCDNVGPVTPKSVDGYVCFFLFRDTCSRRLHAFPVRHADEDTYIDYLYRVLQYYANRGYNTKIIRIDYFSTFTSAAAKEYYLRNNIEHQSSTAYKHWQNAVERDVQKIICNVSAVLHGTELIRAGSWSKALFRSGTIHHSQPSALRRAQ